jgi:hypothetical protein
MYPFPPNGDLQFLIGLEIQQIALDPLSLQFRFLTGGQILVEGQFEHIDQDGHSHLYDCGSLAGRPIYLHELLEVPIVTFSREAFCLSLTFTTGAILRIFSNSGPYECGSISPPDGTERGPIVF